MCLSRKATWIGCCLLLLGGFSSHLRPECGHVCCAVTGTPPFTPGSACQPNTHLFFFFFLLSTSASVNIYRNVTQVSGLEPVSASLPVTLPEDCGVQNSNEFQMFFPDLWTLSGAFVSHATLKTQTPPSLY